MSKTEIRQIGEDVEQTGAPSSSEDLSRFEQIKKTVSNLASQVSTAVQKSLPWLGVAGLGVVMSCDSNPKYEPTPVDNGGHMYKMGSSKAVEGASTVEENAREITGNFEVKGLSGSSEAGFITASLSANGIDGISPGETVKVRVDLLVTMNDGTQITINRSVAAKVGISMIFVKMLDQGFKGINIDDINVAVGTVAQKTPVKWDSPKVD